MHAFNPITGEARGFDFKASLIYIIRPCLKTNSTKKPNIKPTAKSYKTKQNTGVKVSVRGKNG